MPSTAFSMLFSSCTALLVLVLLSTAGTLAVNLPDPNNTPLPACPTALSRRVAGVYNAAASFTNPALCTIADLPYPGTTWAPGTVYTLPSGETATSFIITRPTETPFPDGSTTTTTTTETGSSSPTAAPSVNTTSTSTDSPPSSAASPTIAGAGSRRAAPGQPTGLKSVQRFSGLQISLTLFVGVGILAAITYFLDELLDVLV